MSKVTRSLNNLPGHSWQSTVNAAQIKSEHAVSAMIRLVNEQPGRKGEEEICEKDVYLLCMCYDLFVCVVYCFSNTWIALR